MSLIYEQVLSHLEKGDAEFLIQSIHAAVGGNGVRRQSSEWPYLKLPGLCCQAAGGQPEWAQDLSSAWELFYLAAYFLDNIADGDTPKIERGLESTLAAACISGAELVLDKFCHTHSNFETALAIREDIHRTILRTCTGQIADLAERTPSLERCWQIAWAKTGETYALACRIGGRLATQDEECIALLSEFGLHLGTLVQIGDDMNGLWPHLNTPGDLARSQWTLPVAYAMQVIPFGEASRLQRLLTLAREDPCTEARARQIIVESGAFVYLIAEAEILYNRAKRLLQRVIPAGQAFDGLSDVLERSVPGRNR